MQSLPIPVSKDFAVLARFVLSIATLLLVPPLAFGPAAKADTIVFTGKSQTYVVQAAGSYLVAAYGAQGGSEAGLTGGLGAQISDYFTFTAGEVLTVAVGGQGGSTPSSGEGGGGGGTFILAPGNTLLLVAGGGSGAFRGKNGANATALGGSGQGGTSGSGGGAGGGGGFYSSGHSDNTGVGGSAGGAGYSDGLSGSGGNFGGGAGGYGGGSGGAEAGGGAGGGYTGGNGSVTNTISGSGTSFDAGLNPLLALNTAGGNGYATFTLQPASTAVTPEPASLTLLGTGVLSLAALARKRRRTRGTSPESSEPAR